MVRTAALLIQLFLIAVVTCGLLLVGGRSPAASPPVDELVRVAAVHSGQSLEVSSARSPLAESVRLLGIDAPDSRQEPWGPEATHQLEQWLKGQTIRLEFDGTLQDAYGRKAAYVWLGHELINEKLVTEGWALAQGSMAFSSGTRSTRYEQRLIAAQEKARLLQRGIWSATAPLHQTPGEFRKQEAL
ncbi:MULTISPECIES: thermonuclease family protein [unclassified Leptolyngbya]|uniref:thermonuclease family protein n=1 Tax=unclassified Leptolyngbya TaxID=2650499 RepID=UPI001685A361|nr:MULTISPECIES: thermonuclease family protein [unclassified Leptolyngbya]MBD1913435.1 thermonuclease family protein [Leptolyngbya sp. FACHB-8]MBD2155830.1 thermonuclease family protein [Leptolyngbya sp. FACHB-16]